MNNCRDCKYFRPHKTQNRVNGHIRGNCYNMKLQSDDIDGLEWWGCEEIDIGEGFGCIHWDKG